MSEYYQPAAWPMAAPGPTSHQPLLPAQSAAPESACSSLGRAALMGAMVAGTGAAAINLRRVQVGEIETGTAVRETAQAAAIGAAATAAAGAVAGAIADQGLLRLGLMFAVGTAVVYSLEQLREQRLLDGGEDV